MKQRTNKLVVVFFGWRISVQGIFSWGSFQILRLLGFYVPVSCEWHEDAQNALRIEEGKLRSLKKEAQAGALKDMSV
eukprot:999671-Amphidinium_carterae.2